MDTELHAYITPEGSIHLERRESRESAGQESLLLQKDIEQRFQENLEMGLLRLGFTDPKVPLSDSLAFFRDVAGCFTLKLTQNPDAEHLREALTLPADEEGLSHLLDNAPLMAGVEYLNLEFLTGLWDRLNHAYQTTVSKHKGPVVELIHTYSPQAQMVGRIFFHLVETAGEDTPFAFLATYSTRVNRKGGSKHQPLTYALKEYGQDTPKMLELLTTVYKAAEESAFIKEILESGELFHPLGLTTREAYIFLKEIPIYESAGILCRIPNWWRNRQSDVRLNVTLGTKTPSRLNMDAVLDFTANLKVGDTPITPEEARELLAQSEGLAFIKNKWVAVDASKLAQTLRAYDQAEKLMQEDGLTMQEAMRLQLNPGKLPNGKPLPDGVEIDTGQWLSGMIKTLRQPEHIQIAEFPETFKAELRPYQKQGAAWLGFLNSYSFGACLADDMGLGKTVQMLAFLSTRTFSNNCPASLLILPASLISNWIAEIERFLPSLKYFVAHSSGDLAKDNQADSATFDEYDLVITTYAMARRSEWLHAYYYDCIILDEAQAIKNPGSMQTRAIKKLKSRSRIILTGTPVENRLSDLWSLFDFLNPGLLGNRNEFNRFSKKLKEDTSGYGRLRQVIRPYILRRLKTDKAIIADLPEKVEMKTYAELSREQIVLYRNVVKEIEKMIAETDGIQRKGLVLSCLMKLKQLCNHPAQYDGGGAFEEKRSGKFSRLREICETVLAKRERVLVFTQFREMTEPLHDYLADIFGRPGRLLHGGTPVKKRKAVIADFQSDRYVPFMVLSLKAGGVGLNLTQANHVVHFDRWWNPAVENQATDRAFRIGQRKNVVVHKFITKGTVEEKIDAMIEDKTSLAGEVVATNDESWMTEMNDNELLDMFSLTI